MMKKEKRRIIPTVIILVILIAIAGYVGYYFYAFSQLSIAGMGVDQITDFNLKGFSFSGHIAVMNPNFISVSIQGIEYNVVFEPTEQVLTKGVLEGRKLPAKEVTNIPFQKTVNWAPALSMVLQLVASEEPLNVVLAGNVFVTENIKLPFVYKVDVREYFVKYVEEQKDEVIESAVDKIEERYGKTVGAIAEHLVGYFT